MTAAGLRQNGADKTLLDDELAALSAIRYGGAIFGKFCFVSRRATGNGKTVFPCVSRSLSCYSITVESGTKGDVGDLVLIRLGEIGTVSGAIAKRDITGFTVSINASNRERIKLGRTINWYRDKRLRNLEDRRSFPRYQPREPASTLTMGDGQRLLCTVLDVSRSGAAVLGPTPPPPVGTPLAVGAVVGRVMRHLDGGGFAVQFLKILDPNEVEGVVCKVW